MRICDTHCHIGLLYQKSVEQIRVIDDARRVGVDVLISVNTNLSDFFSSYQNIKYIPNVYHTIGLSPAEVGKPLKDWDISLKEGLSYPNVVAVGEIGLDYFHKYGDRNKQIEFFIRQLSIASNHNLPAVLHNREARDDMESILRSNLSSAGGILHCFSEDYEYACKMFDLGVYISFAGNLTYRNAKNLQEVAKKVPLDMVCIETDSPFLSPSSKRGLRNQPAYIVETLNFFAELRQMSVEELSEILFENSLKAYKIKL